MRQPAESSTSSTVKLIQTLQCYTNCIIHSFIIYFRQIGPHTVKINISINTSTQTRMHACMHACTHARTNIGPLRKTPVPLSVPHSYTWLPLNMNKRQRLPIIYHGCWYCLIAKNDQNGICLAVILTTCDRHTEAEV